MIKRKFYPGSECLFFKLYTNECNLNELLLKLYNYLGSEYWNYCVSKFFYIRYADPDFHIRFRLFLKSNELLLPMIQLINKIYNDELESSIINKIQIDTYERELERYGNENIIESENLFSLESRFILDFMHLYENNIPDSDIYVYLSIWTTDVYLSLSEYSIEEKRNLLYKMSESLKKEFNVGIIERKQLNYIYHSYKRILENILGQNEPINEQWNKSRKLRLEYEYMINDSFAKMKFTSIDDKFYRISSHIHMLNNRIFSVENRKFEMIIYDFLYKYYKSENYKFNNRATPL